MTREVEVHGRRIKLYRVRKYPNAWCSDRSLAHQIGQKRKKLLRELRLTTEEAKVIGEI
ncbi:MAG: hypothetical protein ACE5JU_10980 [Candidatus Binatia bacterium]